MNLQVSNSYIEKILKIEEKLRKGAYKPQTIRGLRKEIE